MTHVIFFSLMMSVGVGLVHYYFWRRMVHDTHMTHPWRRIVTISIVLLGISLPITMLAVHGMNIRLSRSILCIPFGWMGITILLWCLLIGSDVIKIATRFVSKNGFKKTVDKGRRITMNRLFAGAVVTTTGGLAGTAIFKGKLPPVLTKIPVTLKKLPAPLEGFRIVQLTDIHIGNTLDRNWLRNVVAQTNQLKPDLIAITGDVVDGKPDALRKEASVLSQLRAPHGVYFVTGNHEYYSGADEWINEYKSFGIRVLRNENVPIRKGGAEFRLVGIDDAHGTHLEKGHGPDLVKALQGVKETDETILLAHQPKAVFEASEHGIGLMLSGHTHGGQMWPVTKLVLLQQPYNKGLFKHSDTTQIYVSQGTGYWGPPMRLGSVNEIAEITLHAPSSSPNRL